MVVVFLCIYPEQLIFFISNSIFNFFVYSFVCCYIIVTNLSSIISTNSLVVHPFYITLDDDRYLSSMSSLIICSFPISASVSLHQYSNVHILLCTPFPGREFVEGYCDYKFFLHCQINLPFSTCILLSESYTLALPPFALKSHMIIFKLSLSSLLACALNRCSDFLVRFVSCLYDFRFN